MGAQDQTALVDPEDSGIEPARRVVNFEQYRRDNRYRTVTCASTRARLLELDESLDRLEKDNDERRHQNHRNHEALLERYEARQNPSPPPPPAASTPVVHSSPSKKHDWRKFFEDKLKALKKITLAKPDDFMTLLNTIATITDERDHDNNKNNNNDNN
eukprot:Awhi_evm1s11385